MLNHIFELPVSQSSLERDMPKQELNLMQVATCEMG
jgi:hypothetical protein